MIRIFAEANFELHKWHSKIKELEGYDGNNGLIYAKSRLGDGQNETKILGVLWDKATDQIVVTFSYLNVEPTKRGILQKLASCYDPAGLAALILLVGK